MTFIKTALLSTAAFAIAIPALAGDGHMTKKTDKDVEKTKTHAAVVTPEENTEVMGAVETMHPSKINDTVGEILQADGEPSVQSDEDIIVEDYTIEDDVFRAADDDGMIADNAIVVPGSADTLTTVTCPAGTTAQPDMTCMITGDYSPNLDE